mmetsp:Transcript_3190/g.9067  ORF Transcript_3190/g.9067 Transcript_3190/m.9067 type:complete len:205 (-) Transcript_3190:127-741(-)
MMMSQAFKRMVLTSRAALTGGAAAFSPPGRGRCFVSRSRTAGRHDQPNAVVPQQVNNKPGTVQIESSRSSNSGNGNGNDSSSCQKLNLMNARLVIRGPRSNACVAHDDISENTYISTWKYNVEDDDETMTFYGEIEARAGRSCGYVRTTMFEVGVLLVERKREHGEWRNNVCTIEMANDRQDNDMELHISWSTNERATNNQIVT